MAHEMNHGASGPRDCLVLGSGRSGTSLVAGTLAGVGYHMGAALHAARASNPRGFFEAPEVNDLNERLLAPVLAERPRLGAGQRWLGIPRAGARCVAARGEHAAMLALLAARPVCFKDPRFCFTLDAWRPALAEAGLEGRAQVVVFRHPALTATSVVEECGRASYLADVGIDVEHALALWTAQYASVLAQMEAYATERWLVLHYDQALEPAGRARLASFVGGTLDAGFGDKRLRRALPDLAVPAEALALYAELCRRAECEPEAEGRVHALGAALAPPEVSALALVDAGDVEHLAELVADVRAQRGVRVELVLVDRTETGLELDARVAALGVPAGAAPLAVRTVRCANPARGRAWRAALELARAPRVALATPGCRWLAAHLAHALDALAAAPRARAATCDWVLTDAHGQFVDRAHPTGMDGEPGPGFEAGLVLERSSLARIAETAFFPVELALWRALEESGAATYVVEPGFTLPRERYAALWERSREDAALVALAERAREGVRPGELPFEREAEAAPELSVSLCTYQRRATLVRCLEGFARQLVPPGTFELVVVNDGSTDGTRELLDDLELAIPVRVVHRENGGLAAARNTGLALARGRLVLFVNDDTLPAPDLVERHVEAHARLGAEGLHAVLGTFEQPAAVLDGALMRWLEGSTEVFDFATLEDGAELDGLHLYTCNVSVPLALVRAVGGFDESFRHYGCEDADLGLRLEERGCVVHHDPRCRATHDHVLDLDALRRRQRTVGAAYVRLARKHPRVLARWGNEGVTAGWLRAELAAERATRAVDEAAARELASIDVGALLRLGGEFRKLGEEVLARLAELGARLSRAWMMEGYLQGLATHGLAGFAELVAGGALPRPIASAAPRRALAWPDWRAAASLERLLALARPLCAPAGAEGGAPRAALVLRHDPDVDPPREEALAALEAAYARVLPDAPELEVVLEEAPLDGTELARLGRSVDVRLATGTEPADFTARVVAEPLATPEAVAAWLARFEAPAPATEPSAPPIELSVIVPTHDRPAELARLVAALARQDLDPRTYEVFVVDDASTPPAARTLGGLDVPFALHLLRQEGGGPGVARNAALARARGELIVLLNDDALPAPDLLRRHRDAHRRARRPRVVMGTFRLLPRQRRDSFATLVETTALLFPQPVLKPGVLYRGTTLCSGNASLRRADLAAVGGFDERLPYAGGEDTELGLRLERERSLRVLYDPRIACGHDHDLDVSQLARRRRVLGWAALAIERAHGDTGLLVGLGPVGTTPADEAFWESVEREVREGLPHLATLARRVADVCRAERASGRGGAEVARIRDAVECVAHLEHLRGLLAARAGRRPETLAEPAAESARAESGSETARGNRSATR